MTKKLRPPAVESMPVKWWLLINELEEFRVRTGWGLASVWGHVHGERYEQARATFDQVRKECCRLEPGCCECGHVRNQHEDGMRCVGVQLVFGWGIEDCSCTAYVYSKSHTDLA